MAERLEHFCLICGKFLKKYQKKFCSQKCTHLYQTGSGNPMYGRNRSGKNSSFFGKHHTEETKRKISNTRIQKELSKGRNNPRFGKSFKHTKESIKKMSDVKKGKTKSIDTRIKMSESNKGKIFSQETLRKMRISAINRIKRQKKLSNMSPSFNENSCKYFKELDIKNNTSGLYGSNEFYIEELGYWVDYINFDKKLIIEWDENYHYTIDNKLKSKDIIRQKEIEEKFPDFKFIRIREKA